MELTINNLIKMVIAAVVIVVVIVGLYFAMRNYVIPYFAGIGFAEEDEIGGEIGGEAGVCEGKEAIGRIEDGKYKYFWYKDKETSIYFDGKEIKQKETMLFDFLSPDSVIGSVKGYTIEIDNDYKKGDAAILDGALIGGNQICGP